MVDEILKWELENYPELFYRDRDDNLYPQHISEIKSSIIPYKPDTFLHILREMDYPFFEEIWLNTLEHLILSSGRIEVTLGRYIAKMRTPSFRKLRFKDSQYNKDIKEYKPNITWKYMT